MGADSPARLLSPQATLAVPPTRQAAMATLTAQRPPAMQPAGLVENPTGRIPLAMAPELTGGRAGGQVEAGERRPGWRRPYTCRDASITAKGVEESEEWSSVAGRVSGGAVGRRGRHGQMELRARAQAVVLGPPLSVQTKPLQLTGAVPVSWGHRCRYHKYCGLQSLSFSFCLIYSLT